MISWRRGILIFLLILAAIGFDSLVMDPWAAIILNGVIFVPYVAYRTKERT